MPINVYFDSVAIKDHYSSNLPRIPSWATNIKIESNTAISTHLIEDGKISKNAEIIFKNGDYYEGEYLYYCQYSSELKNDFQYPIVPHGKGVMKCKNGDAYVGTWFKGLKSGKGKITYSNGEGYDGEFIDDKFSGKGTLTEVDGAIWEGLFVNGEKTVHGKYIKEPTTGVKRIVYRNGDIYDGDWVNGQKHGNGKYTWTNGNIYEGDWVNGRKHGEGILAYANGDVYEGDFSYDNMHGFGTYFFKNGDVYVGEFYNGCKHGSGKMYYNLEKKAWSGKFKYNKKSLIGKKIPYEEITRKKKITAPSVGEYKRIIKEGDVYEGIYVNGALIKGKITILDDGIYEGSFLDERLHGEGKITCDNGDVYEGTFVNGQLTGKGKITYANGEINEGTFTNGRLIEK